MKMEDVLEHIPCNEKKKGERKRKKKLMKEIQKQIEFYFGNANLRHDRFLRQEICAEPQGYVNIDVVASFNKMKNMSTDIGLIVKSTRNSSQLEVSDDGKKVRRVIPLPEVTNTDTQTIYVEHLPPYANHDWLSEVFSTCGKVEYISLPRYKNSGEIKGFAFIEYSVAEEALKACQVLNTVHARRDKQKEAEECGQVVKPSEDDAKEIEPEKTEQNSELNDSEETASKIQPKVKGRKKRKSTHLSESDTECTFEKAIELTKSKKRRKCISESANLSDSCLPDVDYTHKKRKRRITVCDSSLDIICVDIKDSNAPSIADPLTGSKRKRTSDSCNSVTTEEDVDKRNDTDRLTAETEIDATTKIESVKKEKKRRRKKKAKEQKDLCIPPLYVIAKKEWLDMKKLYKTLQRNETRKTKAQLKSERTRTVHRNLKQNHLSTDVTTNDNTNYPAKPLTVPFLKGAVLRLFDVGEDILKSNIKGQLSQIASVAYLDLKEGQKEGYARFTNPEGAKTVMESLSSSKTLEDSKSIPAIVGYELAELTEAEEELYYKKIEEDRQQKFNSKSKKTKQRGRDKVQENVDKAHDKVNAAKREHVRFGET